MIYTPEHREMMASIRRFISTEIDPFVDEWEAAELFPAHELFRKMGKLGFLGITKPEAYGGALDELLAQWLSRICTCAPHANQALKPPLQRCDREDVGALLDDAARRFAACMRDEGAEGIAAFREKRAAAWHRGFNAADVREAQAAAALEGEDQSDGAFVHAAADIGFPVMVKAAAGGGGLDMRLVHEAAALAARARGGLRQGKAPPSPRPDIEFCKKMLSKVFNV